MCLQKITYEQRSSDLIIEAHAFAYANIETLILPECFLNDLTFFLVELQN